MRTKTPSVLAWLGVVVVTIAVTGCLRSPSVACDGYTCPAGTVCGAGLCLAPAQTTACSMRPEDEAEAEPCEWGTEPTQRGICKRDGSELFCVPGCGDGSRGGEE